MRSRWQRLTVAVIAAFVIAGLLVVGHQSSLARRSVDFTINYSAGLLIRVGHPQAIYQRVQLGPLRLRVSDNALVPRLTFDVPPGAALHWLPLTVLSLSL